MIKKVYKVTIHEHIIYDYMVEAVSEEEAQEIAESVVVEEDRSKWEQDYNAGWIDIGDIEDTGETMEDIDA